MKQLRILIADDSAPLRVRIAHLVAEHAGMEVVGQAQNAEEALEATQRLKPDVLILDLEMPGKSGLQVLQEVKHKQPGIIVIILTNHDYPQYRRVCTERGADFFLAKNTEGTKLPGILHHFMRRAGEVTANYVSR